MATDKWQGSVFCFNVSRSQPYTVLNVKDRNHAPQKKADCTSKNLKLCQGTICYKSLRQETELQQYFSRDRGFF